MSIEGLPLPPPADILERHDDLLNTWRSVNHWYGLVEQADQRKRKDSLKKIAGHIQLGCKYLHVTLRDLVTKNESLTAEARSSYITLLKQVYIAGKSVSGPSGGPWSHLPRTYPFPMQIMDVPCVKELYKDGSATSYQVASASARQLYINVNHLPALRAQDVGKTLTGLSGTYGPPLEDLQECERVWQNIERYRKTERELIITAGEARQKLKWLQEETFRHDGVVPSQGRTLDEVDLPEMPKSKRAR